MESLGYLVTITGLMNGLNPCALGLMMTFLGYLMVFAPTMGKRSGEKKRFWVRQNDDKGILVLGGLYLFGVIMAYLLLGLVFYRLAYGLQRSVWVGVIKYVLAGVIFIFGLIQVAGVRLLVPKKLSIWFSGLMKKVNGPVSVLIGALTAVISAPCTLPVYVGTAMVLSRLGMAPVKTLLYFVYYNFLFVAPLMVVLLMAYKGKRVVEMKEWNHRSERLLRFVGGLVLLFLAWWMIR